MKSIIIENDRLSSVYEDIRLKLKPVILVLLSSILFPLALQNELFKYGNPLLGLVSLSFYFWAIYETKSLTKAVLYGALFGVISTVIANYWLMNFGDFALYTLGGTALGYMVFNIVLVIILHGFSQIKPNYRPFIIAAVFCIYEYVKSIGFTGYPWGLIAYTSHLVLPFQQFSDITGLWGISYLLLLVNTLLAEYFFFRFSELRNSLTVRSVSMFSAPVFSRLKKQMLFGAGMIVLFLVYGIVRLAVGFPETDSLSTLLIQQNSDPWASSRAVTSLKTAGRLTFEGLSSIEQNNQPLPDLIVWNETALKYEVPLFVNYPFLLNDTYRTHFPGIFTDFNAPTLTGAPGLTKSGTHYNAAILLREDGFLLDFYAKQHPVPFVEQIPFYEVPAVRDFFNTQIRIGQSWTMGTETKLLTLNRKSKPPVQFGTPICFEDVFSDLCRQFVVKGADVLINITNDSWSQTESALYQHIAAARFRSIENRISLVRGTNAGITCIIDASGNIISEVPLFTEQFLYAKAPLYGNKTPTLYTLFGDYFPILLYIILALVLFHDFFKNKIKKIIAGFSGK